MSKKADARYKASATTVSTIAGGTIRNRPRSPSRRASQSPVASESNSASGDKKGETLEPTMKQSMTPRCARQKKDNKIAVTDQQSVDRARFDALASRVAAD